MHRPLDLLSTLMLQSLRRTARLRARVTLWRHRGVNAVLVLLLLIPGPAYPAASQGHGLTDDEIEAAIASVADTPLSGTPLRLRKAALETLSPFAVPAPPAGGEDDDDDDDEGPPVLPLKFLTLLAEDNALSFVDQGRISNPIVLQHDRTLTRTLEDLRDHDRVTPAAQQAYLQGLVLILLADRHIVELALADAQGVLDGAGAGASQGGDEDDDEGCEFDDDDDDDDSDDGLDARLERALASACAAERRHADAMKALRRGRAASAARAFARAWTYADAVAGVWGIEYEADHDADGLVDVVELRIGSSVFTDDTDRDGLSDAFEVKNTIPHTMPDTLDTDEDAIPDADEDLDEDQLTNGEEAVIGTDPLVPDTDRDGLLDGAEVQLSGFDPRLPDTDGDGLRDDSELRLGADPSDPDSDGDGIPDGSDTYFQIVALPDFEVIVELEGVADHQQSLRGHSLAEVPHFAEVPGLVAAFIALGDELPISRATVRTRYDPAQVPGGDTANLRLLRYDFEEGVTEILPNQQIDPVLQEIRAETVELGAFGIVYLPEWEAAFASASLPPAANMQLSLLVLANWAPPQDSEAALQVEISPISTETPTAVATATIEPSPTAEPTPDEDEIPLPVPILPAQQLPGAQRPGPSIQQASPGDAEFVIAGGPAIQHGVALAYDPVGRQYLAVWVDDTDRASVLGRLYHEQGEPVGAAFLVAESTVGLPIRLDLVPNETDGGFLVIWSEANGGQSVETYCLPGGGCLTQTLDTYNLYAAVIAPGGGANGATTLVTDRLTFWNWVELSSAYDVAYNSFSHEYLVVWNQPRGGLISNVAHPHRMLAQRLDPTGAPVGAQAVLVDRMVSSVTVTYNRARHEYLITFDTFPTLALEYELSAQRLHGTTLAALGATNLSGNVVGSQFSAAAAHDPTGDRYLVSWWDNRDSPGGLGDLRGRILTGTLDAVGPLQKWLDPPDPAEGVFLWEPRAAFSSVEGRFLVLSGFGAGPDLHGRYVLPDSAPDGEAFLIASRAIQGGIGAGAPDGEELPHWLVAWNQGDDVLARMYPQAPSGELDSDFDGLTDTQELGGSFAALLVRLRTDPFEADTDGDGLIDPDEFSFTLLDFKRTFPTFPDSDSDSLEDFVEEQEFAENPHRPVSFLRDTDFDGLFDGEEVLTFGTDPVLRDSDGDGFEDDFEVNFNMDPLVFSEVMTEDKAIQEFLEGAFQGEFGLDDPGNGNLPYFFGLLASGLIGAIPSPINVLGVLADVRDAVAALGRGDIPGAGLNLVGLIPYLGDLTDLPSTTARFVARYGHTATGIAMFIARADEVPQFIRVTALFAAWGDEVRDGLRALGFADGLLLRMAREAIDGPSVLRALARLPEGQRLTRFSEFVQSSLDADVAKIVSQLRGLAHADEAANLGRLSNIKGAYAEWLTEQLRRADGWQFLHGRKAVNAAGYDLIVTDGRVVRLIEAKARQALRLRDVRNYLYIGSDGLLRLNKRYFDQFSAGIPAAENAFRAGNLQIEILINSSTLSRSQGIIESLVREMGLEQGAGILARYEVVVDGVRVPRSVEVFLTALSN